MREKVKYPGSNHNPTKRRFIAVIISVTFILATILMLTTPAQAAQGWIWNQTGSNTPGSYVYSLAYDGSKLYAGCYDGTVYELSLIHI